MLPAPKHNRMPGLASAEISNDIFNYHCGTTTKFSDCNVDYEISVIRNQTICIKYTGCHIAI